MKEGCKMIVTNAYYALELSDDGKIISYSDGIRDYVNAQTKPLLEVKLLDANGHGIYTNSSNAVFSAAKTAGGYRLTFEQMAEGLTASVNMRCPVDEPFIYWSCEIENRTGHVIEWVGLPGLVVENGLKGHGGDSELFWPFGEGCIVENTDLRQGSEWLRYREISGQSAGYNGTYPGPVAMQFMAYYNDHGGLYISAEDPQAYLKSFEYYPYSGGICLEMRCFADGAFTNYKLPFEVKTGFFKGNWQDAADIYKAWLENTDGLLPEKIKDNKHLPEWYAQSPVVALYPIRGTKDHGDMSPNMYYPYKNALAYIEKYAEELGSRIMALPMHWEGTAPWAPPFVWPPYGGEKQFREFADALHEKNNLLGVYCSGIGWTAHSYLADMDISDKYDEKLICKTPEGEIKQSKIIGPPIRDGYDMCPESSETANIVKGEVEALANAGCDYTQYFDQNLGGNGCFCYAKDHGHPYTPGKWQCDAMKRIFKTATENIDGRKMLIGCEAAAAEPFIKYLPFNDLRSNIALFFGKSVPAYAYLFHEYINNFMGNQNTIDRIMDLTKNPDNLLMRTAYSFAAGDMLSVCLGKDGKISWGWDVDWDTPPANQKDICEFIANANAWRRGFAGKYLHTGKMIKAEKVSGIGTYRLNCVNGRVLEYPDVFTTAFEACDGEKAMILTNYLGQEKELGFDGERKIWLDPTDENNFIIADKITLKPHTVAIVQKKMFE